MFDGKGDLSHPASSKSRYRMYEFMDIFCASEIGGTEDDAILS